MQINEEVLDATQLKIFKSILGCTVMIGIFVNILLLILLIIKGLKSRMTNILLRNQSILDCLVCLSTFLLIIHPDIIITGNTYIDLFFCHAWTGQTIFWYFVLAGIFNLVFTALDRYRAIINPHLYHTYATGKVSLMMIMVYLGSAIITTPVLFQVSLVNDTCLSKNVFEGEISDSFYKAFSIIWFMSVYGMPSTIMIYLYSKIIIMLRKTFVKVTVQRSKYASKALTKALIVITIVFLFTISYDAIYYILGYWKLTDYILNSPLQLIGVFLTAFNSTMNPIVLFIIVRSFRVRIYRIFRFIMRKDPNINESSSENS